VSTADVIAGGACFFCHPNSVILSGVIASQGEAIMESKNPYSHDTAGGQVWLSPTCNSHVP